MRRLLLLWISIVAFASISLAGQISREQAMCQAQQFLGQKSLSRSLMVAETQMSKARARGKNTPDYYYVFNAGQNQGFVIVSGDDSTEEILAYATSGTFDVNNLPPAMEALLDYYAAQISLIQQGRAQAAPKLAPHPAISPFMTVKWGQGEPFNAKTPLGYYSNVNNGYNCMTGCVATAMAQVLYHQHFVNATQAEIPGYQNSIAWKSPSGTKTATLSAVPAGSALDWENMVDIYEAPSTTTQIQKDAVADLMLYCGQAVRMKYNLKTSSASVADVPDALKNYFGYSRGTRYITRSDYSASDWDDIIYNEVAAGRPVIYGGQTGGANSSGHAFIIHGYDGNGKYAVNWGWEGSQDNYFTLSNLTPPNKGIGGGSEDGGYNYDQEAVVYLAKEDGSFSETVRLTTEYLELNNQSEFTKNGSQFYISFKAKFVSRLANTYNISYNYAIYKDGVFMEYLDPDKPLNTFTFTNKTFFPSGEVINMHLPYYDGTTLHNAFKTPGTYKIVPVSREESATEWLENDGSDKYYLTAVCTDTKLTLYVGEPGAAPEVSDAQRDELNGILNSLKDKIIGKQSTASTNASEINALKSALVLLNEAVGEAETKLAVVMALVMESTVLTDDQKSGFNTKIDALMTNKDNLNESLTFLASQVENIEAANNELYTRLTAALTSLDSQITSVSGITTTVALEAAYDEKSALETQVDGCDVNALTTDINSIKEAVVALDANSLTTLVATLEGDVNKAIEDAEAAIQAEKEKKELEEAKAGMNEAIDAVTSLISAKTDSIEANKKAIVTLNTVKAAAEVAKRTVLDKIEEVKSMLDNKNLTEEQKNSYTEQFALLESKIKEYEDVLEDFTKKLNALESSNSDMEKKLGEANNSIADLKAKVDAATTIDDVDVLKENVDGVKTSVNSLSVADVTDGLAALTKAVTDFTNDDDFNALKDLLAAIEKDIEISISEEEKAALLREAKEKMQAEIEALQNKLDAVNNDMKKVETDLAKLVETIAKGEETLIALKAKAEEIKQLLEENKTARTRSGLSDEQRTAYQVQLYDLNAKIAGLEKTLEELKDAKAGLESTLNTAKSTAESLSTRITALTTSLEAAADIEAIEALGVEMLNINMEIDNIQTDTEKMTAEIAAGVEEAVTFKEETETVQTEAETLVNEVNEATGINNIGIDESEIQARYDMNGRPVDENYKGIVIIRTKDGQTMKLNTKR